MTENVTSELSSEPDRVTLVFMQASTIPPNKVELEKAANVPQQALLDSTVNQTGASTATPNKEYSAPPMVINSTTWPGQGQAK